VPGIYLRQGEQGETYIAMTEKPLEAEDVLQPTEGAFIDPRRV
jgi:hypothetical protein